MDLVKYPPLQIPQTKRSSMAHTHSLFDIDQIPLKGNVSHWQFKNTAETALGLINKAKKQPGLVVFLTSDMAQANLYQEQLRFFAEDSLPILTFPEWETLPYDQFSPHQDIISERLKTLYRLPSLQKGVLILPVSTLLQKVVPHTFIKKHTFLLACNDILPTDNFAEKLETGGYQRVSQVMEHGEFAVRGSIIDLFPMGSKTPFRLDLFDDEVETIRSFDPETQRTIDTIERIELLPAKEYDLTDEGIQRFRQSFRTEFGDDSRNSQLYKAVTQQHTVDGLEYYLSLFHEDTATCLTISQATACSLVWVTYKMPSNKAGKTIKNASTSHATIQTTPSYNRKN